MQILSPESSSHIITLLKQKFISPYKIIYMLDQKQGDFFKSRNQSHGCCSSSSITIPQQQQTKIQKQLAYLISQNCIQLWLNELLEYCEDRFQGIAQKGKNDNLKITAQVQKYLINNIMSEAVNRFIFNKLANKIQEQSKSLKSEIGMWATPATWYQKYPNLQLNFINSKNLSQLFNNKVTIITDLFKNIYEKAFSEFELLEKDGRFQQLISFTGKIQDSTNCKKILKDSSIYTAQNNESFSALTHINTVLQSIPFEMNLKANLYLTILNSIQVSFYNCSPFQKQNKIDSCKYLVILPINVDLSVKVQNQSHTLKKGELMIVQSQQKYSFENQTQKKGCFIIKSHISQAKRKN